MNGSIEGCQPSAFCAGLQVLDWYSVAAFANLYARSPMQPVVLKTQLRIVCSFLRGAVRGNTNHQYRWHRMSCGRQLPRTLSGRENATEAARENPLLEYDLPRIVARRIEKRNHLMVSLLTSRVFAIANSNCPLLHVQGDGATLVAQRIVRWLSGPGSETIHTDR